MLSLPPTVRILLAREPADLRCSSSQPPARARASSITI
jgi:hypothetical protein